MTSTQAAKKLAKIAELISAEGLPVKIVFLSDSGISIDLLPADFAKFVRRHRLQGAVRTDRFASGTIHCWVRFRRAFNFTTDLEAPAQLAQIRAGQREIESSTTPMLEVDDV